MYVRIVSILDMDFIRHLRFTPFGSVYFVFGVEIDTLVATAKRTGQSLQKCGSEPLCVLLGC